ncbi:MAG: DNA-processing protein DprA [Pseudonocardiaceae bacterium]
MTSRSERGALVALLQDRPSDLTWRRLAAEVGDVSSAVEVYARLSNLDLFSDPDGHGERFERAAGEIESWEAEGIGVHTMLDDTYPGQLREVLHMPPIVFTRGTLAPDTRSVAIVGSRTASQEGIIIASRLATELSERGYTIVSGGAKGIDSAAHEAALTVGGRTVAVLGTGVRTYFPPENRALHDRIAREGLVLSQFWPDSCGTKHTFPMRNATMSGYVTATVVVEAGERSGTRIQARSAVEHGRPVLLAAGVVRVNRWAQDLRGQPGVHVVSGLEDVLRVLDRSDDSGEAVRKLLGSVTT